jgi:hypothetical protein
MRNRKQLLAVGTVAFVLLGLLLIVWRYSPSKWARAYSRIQLGMTRQQVETAIGLPPGYYEGEYPKPHSMSRFVKTPPLQQSGIAFEKCHDDGLEHLELNWLPSSRLVTFRFGSSASRTVCWGQTVVSGK